MRAFLITALLASAAPAVADDAAAPRDDAAPVAGAAAAEATPADAAPADAVLAPAPAAPVAEPEDEGRSARRRPPFLFGLSVDAGVPEGLALGLTFRPVDSIRFWAGPAWNYLSWGVHGGVAIVPVAWAVSPAVSLEGGRFFAADLRRFVNDGSGAPDAVDPLLADLGYDYLAAHVGLEMGSQRGLAFTVRAGLAWIRATAHGSTKDQSTAGGGTAETYWVNPRLTASLPSVKVGLQYTF